MNVLAGCEESGRVRDAFRRLGHTAYSCDLEPNDDALHLQMDIFDAIRMNDWDLIILFPPCTHLAVSGNRWHAGTQERADAIQWTLQLWRTANQHANRVAMENPVGALSTAWRPPNQYIQPWQFGHGETKKTGLWLHGLPELTATDIVEGREERVWRMGPGPDRAKLRGKTYQGVADAMAAQWSISHE